MNSNGTSNRETTKDLPILNEVDVAAELAKFEAEERKRRGLDGDKPNQWVEDMVGLTFTRSQKSKVTILVGGLTIAHDTFVQAGLKDIGYNVHMMEVPTTRGSATAKSSRRKMKKRVSA